MANNIWNFDAYMSNLAQSLPWPDIITAQTAYQSYDPVFVGNHAQIAYIQSPLVPTEIAIRGLYPLHCVTLRSGFIYCGFPPSVSVPSQAHQTINFADSGPFLRMPEQVVVMPAQPTLPPQVISPEMNNTLVATESPVLGIYGREEGESSSDGTKPYIKQLDQPIKKNEFDELAAVGGHGDDGGYDLQTSDYLALKL